MAVMPSWWAPSMLHNQGVLHELVEGHVCEQRIDAFRKAADILRSQTTAAGN